MTKAAGYIIVDNEGLIWGWGRDRETVWKQVETQLNASRALASPADRDLHPAIEDMRDWRASAALLKLIAEEGGEVAWVDLNDVAVTRAEAA